jgi:outer membrane protein assembly factor BamB
MRTRTVALVPALLLGGLFAVPEAVGQEDPPALPVQPLIKRQPVRRLQPDTPPGAKLSDEEALKKAGLSVGDAPKLLEYLRQRTLSDVDQGKITEIINRFGADDFDDRVKATEEVELFGPAAIGPLRKKAEERDGDPEVTFRAKLALKKVETVPHSAVAAAAVRAVVKLKPEGAAGALIGFLPVADTEVVADVIREALVALAVRDGKADPALVAALADKSPLRRAAAYVALTEGGPADERIRIKDAYPKLKEAVLADADPETKFLGLWALALTTREKEFLPELIGLIPKLPRGRIWQLEELLLLMAGTHPKEGRFLKSPESLGKARDAWLGWWKEKGEKFDLVKFEYKPRIKGLTEVIELDQRGYGQSRVISLGPDLKEKWRLTSLNYPTDVRVAPNGNIWVVEMNTSQVREFSPEGKPLNTRGANYQPMNIDLTADGGMIVVCRNQIIHWDKDGKQVWAHQWQNQDIVTGRRMPGGETIFVTVQQVQGGNAHRVTEKGQDAKKSHQLGRVQQPQSMDVIGEDRVLVCEFNRVAEYDLKTGKEVWKHDCQPNSAQSCQRLPNGNTLISLLNQNQVIEVDPSGEVVWEYAAKDGLRVGRAYRR